MYASCTSRTGATIFYPQVLGGRGVPDHPPSSCPHSPGARCLRKFRHGTLVQPHSSCRGGRAAPLPMTPCCPRKVSLTTPPGAEGPFWGQACVVQDLIRLKRQQKIHAMNYSFGFISFYQKFMTSCPRCTGPLVDEVFLTSRMEKLRIIGGTPQFLIM